MHYKRYEDAFRSLGINTEDIDPNHVIQICVSHGNLKKELELRHEEEIAQIALKRNEIVRQILLNLYEYD